MGTSGRLVGLVRVVGASGDWWGLERTGGDWWGLVGIGGG
jgi:hypothetical protein